MMPAVPPVAQTAPVGPAIVSTPPPAPASTSRQVPREAVTPREPTLPPPEPRAGASHMTPEDLQNSDEPIKSLRRDRSTSSLARGILQEIGIMAGNERDRRRRGRGGKHRELIEGADWPEDYVYRLDGTEPSYDSLTLAEFVAAVFSIMEELTPITAKNAKVIRLFHYYRAFMEDCFEVDWPVVRTAHKQVLQGLEHKRIFWSDAASCIDTKRNALQRAQRRNMDVNVNVAPAPASTSQGPHGGPVHPCPEYQILGCTFHGEHWVNDQLMSHCCAWCIRILGQRYPHPEELCRKRLENVTKKSKNSRGRGRRPNPE